MQRKDWKEKHEIDNSASSEERSIYIHVSFVCIWVEVN